VALSWFIACTGIKSDTEDQADHGLDTQASDATTVSAPDLPFGPIQCIGKLRIPDPSFRALLEQRLGQPTITAEALAELAELVGDDWEIIDLEGLQCASGLELLSLRDNRIVDIGGIHAAAGLRRLYLDDNPIVRLVDLSSLTMLENLSIARTGITSLEPVAASTSLLVLGLDGSPVTDLSHIASFPRLWSLSIIGTNVTSLAALDGAPALTRVHARCLQLGDDAVAVAASWPALADVDLAFNRIHSVAALLDSGPIGVLTLGNPPTGGPQPCEDRNRIDDLELLLEHGGIDENTTLRLHYAVGVEDCPVIDALELRGAVVEVHASLDCP